jgi:predicted nucleic acid-binding protein
MSRSLVSNTGPIIAFALIDRLDILQSLFEPVTISEAVHKELVEGGPSGRGLLPYQEASWIKVQAFNSCETE